MKREVAILSFLLENGPATKEEIRRYLQGLNVNWWREPKHHVVKLKNQGLIDNSKERFVTGKIGGRDVCSYKTYWFITPDGEDSLSKNINPSKFRRNATSPDEVIAEAMELLKAGYLSKNEVHKLFLEIIHPDLAKMQQLSREIIVELERENYGEHLDDTIYVEERARDLADIFLNSTSNQDYSRNPSDEDIEHLKQQALLGDNEVIKELSEYNLFLNKEYGTFCSRPCNKEEEDSCVTCLNELCDDCLVECEVCGNRSCAGCAEICDNCSWLVCKECLISCNNCGHKHKLCVDVNCNEDEDFIKKCDSCLYFYCTRCSDDCYQPHFLEVDHYW